MNGKEKQVAKLKAKLAAKNAANGGSGDIPPGSAHLYFDGACRPNPGRGGAGGWLVFVTQNKKLGTLPVCHSLGHSTAPTAEYLALIWGLYKARIEKVTDVVIFGDSDFVMEHMKTKDESESQSSEQSTYKVLQHICGVLLSKFKTARFQKIPKEQNQRADTLAVQGIHMVEGRYPEGTYTFYYPNPLGHSVCQVNGVEVMATNDFGKPSPDGFFFIDAAYLYAMHKEKFPALMDRTALASTRLSALTTFRGRVALAA